MTIDDFGWVVLILASVILVWLVIAIASRAYERRRAAELAEERWIGGTLALQELGIREPAVIEAYVARRAPTLRLTDMPLWLTRRVILDWGWSWDRYEALIARATRTFDAEREPR